MGLVQLGPPIMTFPSEESQQWAISKLNDTKVDARPIVIASGDSGAHQQIGSGQGDRFAGNLDEPFCHCYCSARSRIRCPSFGDICCDDLGTSQGFFCTAELTDVVANLADWYVNDNPLELRPSSAVIRCC
jgi:hypothetical protein